MNFKLLAKILGFLALLVSAAMLACAAFGHLSQLDPDAHAVRPLVISAIVGAILGILFIIFGHRAHKDISRREALAVVGIGWILCCSLGALPYVFGEPKLFFVDAWFESVSGFTTTGSTVISDVDLFPRSLLLWRSLTQWLGGLGILVLFVALLSYLGVGSKALFRHESSAQSGRELKSRVQDVAIRLWLIYAGLSMICMLGLWALGMTPYEAVTHTFTAISTGGFSTENASVSAFGSLAIELWLVIFMILGSISFLLYAWLLQGVWSFWRRDEETRAFSLLILTATLVIALDLIFVSGHSMGQAFREALFQVVTIVTTTGYATADYNTWPPFSAILLLALMCIGGCSGSTAGGLKIARWLVFFKIARQQIINAFRPSQTLPMKLNGFPLAHEFRTQTVFLISLSGVTIFFGAGCVSLLEPKLDMDTSLSAAIACLFNIGPGIGLVGPRENFAFFSPGAKVFLSFLMLLGRLEFFAILALFSPALWRRY